MKTSTIGQWVTIALGVAAVCVVTVLQGRMTDRWTGKNISQELRMHAEKLEQGFPKEFGPWKLDVETEADPLQLKAAGAVGHVSREYRHTDTGVRVGVFVVCATPSDASGHTPDRCYPNAGFEAAEQEHREMIPLGNGGKAEAFSGSFKKPGEALRILWTYAAGEPNDKNGSDGQTTIRWIAPQIARIELANFPSVYKIYALINETAMPRGEGTRTGVQFLADLIPEFDRTVFAGAVEGEAADGAASARASSSNDADGGAS